MSQLTMDQATQITLSMEASMEDVNQLNEKVPVNAVSVHLN